MILFLFPKNIVYVDEPIYIDKPVYVDEPVAKKSKLSFVTECDTIAASIPSTSASTSSDILLTAISEMPNDSSTEVQIISVDTVLKTYDVSNFDLRHLLRSHIMGRAILLKYDKQRFITNIDRNNLCEIIVCHFLNEGKRLNNATISILADKIIELFEGEKKSTYYVSPVGKSRSRNNKPEVAKGKLIDKHRNKLSILRKTIAISDIPEAKKTQGIFFILIYQSIYKIYFVQHSLFLVPSLCYFTRSYYIIMIIISEISREIKDSQIWLKQNNEPEDEVMHHWKLSFPMRKKTHSPLDEFFDEWPILKTQAAIYLVK